MTTDSDEFKEHLIGHSGDAPKIVVPEEYDVFAHGDTVLGDIRAVLDMLEARVNSVRDDQEELDEDQIANALQLDDALRAVIGRIGVLSLGLKQLAGKDSGTRPNSVVAHPVPAVARKPKTHPKSITQPVAEESPQQTTFIQTLNDYISGLTNVVPNIESLEDIKTAEKVISSPLKGDLMRADDIREAIADARARLKHI